MEKEKELMLAELKAIREAREVGNKAIEDLAPAIKVLEDKVDKLAAATPLDPVKLAADEKFMKFVDEICLRQLKAAYEADKERGKIAGQLVDATGWTWDQRHMLTPKQLERYYPSDTLRHITLMQELSDEALLVGTILHGSARRAQQTNDPLPNNYIKTTRAYKQLMKLRAMDTLTAGEGLEWIPTEFSGQLYDVVTVSLKVAALLPSIPMPSPTFKIPVATTDDIAFLVPENITDAFLNDANKIPTITPGTGQVTMTAKKLGCLSVFSEEVTEDSIIAIIPFTRGKLGNAIANGIERAILDGDTAATHQDNDVSSAADARKAWNGIRKDTVSTALDVQAATDTAFTALDLLNLRGVMTEAFAEDPENLAYVVSVNTMLRMCAFTEMLTLDKVGPAATILRGMVGRIWGVPVITSKYVRTNVAATGVNTVAGPNTLGVVYLINRNGYLLGNRRGVTIKTADVIWSDQGIMASTWRGDFQKLYVGSKVAALGRNVPTT